MIYISQYAYNVLETMDKIRKKESQRSSSPFSGEVLHELRNNIRIANNLTLEAELWAEKGGTRAGDSAQRRLARVRQMASPLPVT